MKRTVAQLLVVFVTVLSHGLTAHAHPGDGLVVDREGTLYFVARNPLHDTDHHACVYRFREGDGAATPFYTSTHPSSNVYIVLGRDGNLYGAESNYHGEQHGQDRYTTKVWRFDEDGTRTEVLGSRPGRSPYGGAAYLVDENGTFFYAVDSTIRQRDKNGNETEFFKTTKSAPDAEELESKIFNLAWGPNGEIYILYLNRIEVLETEGKTRLLYAGLENLPFDMDVDQSGNVYLPDWRANEVLRVSNAGERTSVMKSGKPFSPEGVAVNGDDLIILEFTGPPATKIVPRIRKQSPDGSLETIWEF